MPPVGVALGSNVLPLPRTPVRSGRALTGWYDLTPPAEPDRRGPGLRLGLACWKPPAGIEPAAPPYKGGSAPRARAGEGERVTRPRYQRIGCQGSPGEPETTVDKVGFEPTTLCLQGRRSPGLSYSPVFTSMLL